MDTVSNALNPSNAVSVKVQVAQGVTTSCAELVSIAGECIQTSVLAFYEGEKSHYGMIIGITFGVFGFLVIVGIVVICCCVRK